MTREEILPRAILRLTTGSHAYGLNVEGSDRDSKWVVIEPINEVCGLGTPWEGKVYSQSGEDDFEVFGLRKFVNLALKGNPTVTEMLFIQPDYSNALGSRLREMAPLIVSRQVGKAYLGYLHAQRLRLLGMRKNGGHGLPRTTLVDQFGFDTKFAMHMLRLGIQGMELLTRGALSLPLKDPDRQYLLDVRGGKHSIEECLQHAETLEESLRAITETSSLPAEPRRDEVERWMLERYFHWWSAERPHGGLGGLALSSRNGSASAVTTVIGDGSIAKAGSFISAPADVSKHG